jgi:hypothetical protein
MNEMEYWERMITIRYAELAVQEAILQNLIVITMKQGGQPALQNWKNTKNFYENAKAVIAALPHGG